ncbi:MAG: hypothetical protein ABFD97_19990 [Syntrophobacter sp.]
MREKIAEIVETLEKADQLFNELDAISEEARSLWSAGIEKLAGAIWVYEYKEREVDSGPAAEDPAPATSTKL